MLKIFDRNEGEYIFPNGATKTVSEMKEDPQYAILFSKDCVANVIDGMLTFFQPLGQFADNYGFEYSSDSEENPEEVLEKIKSKIEYDKKNPPLTISDTVRKAVTFAALTFTDEQALEVRDLYPAFEIGHSYKKDERFTYNGHLFKVNQDHTSQEQWVPGETGTESLYTSLEMGDNGHLNWQQPTGSHDAYNTGDIVNYKGELYKSLIDGNAWAPDVYPAGWEKYTEPTS